ncbi:MAG TPA: CDP-alcohol phosphatidyltransferase family protein [Candidatus Sulfotelmatobacter sp.]|jgi:CDP-diacylglycerol--glycerol-3-phosphate 3-phosphatidyltransferase|nr:CDP-alcohol phosphatidyltransferase family protein [Candidatus Sulfotelmatobacter sp.]
MKFVPFALTTLRLVLGPIALLSAMAKVTHFVYLPILIVGTLSDIYDGILARRLGVATPALRRYDSITDVIFYLFILGATWITRHELVVQNWIPILLILASEIAVVLVCFYKFGKYPATHSWLAKFYGLCLLAGLIALLVFNAGSWAIISLTTVAVITNAEIIAIHLLMKTPPVDVKTVFKIPKAGKGKSQPG